MKTKKNKPNDKGLSHILPIKLFTLLCVGLLYSTSNQSNTDIKNKELQEMIRRDNLPNLKTKPELVKK